MTPKLEERHTRRQFLKGLGALAALGDDNRAAAAYGEAAELVEAFAPTLTPERGTRLLRAPAIADILSLAGRSDGPSTSLAT